MKESLVVLLASIGSLLLVACGGEDCEARSDIYCDPGTEQVYWMDSCGMAGDVKEVCECGCLFDNSGCAPVSACGCGSNDDCDANSICVYGDCVTAYGRRYEFTIVSAVISETGHDGDSWDFPGGLPDPYINIYRNESELVAYTSSRLDTLSPTYNYRFQADIYASDRWDFQAFDEDVSSNDFIEGIYLDPIPVSIIKAGGFYWDQGDYLEELVVTIEPVE